jgi:hypothetical protein
LISSPSVRACRPHLEGIEVLRKLIAVVTTAAAGTAVLLAGGTASAAAVHPATCSGTVQIRGLAFDPNEAPPGGSSDVTLKLRNCTGLSQTVSETWYGRFSSAAAPGIPAGCPVYDPILIQATLPPHARLSRTAPYGSFPGCTADRLTVTVTVSQGATTLGTANADLTFA